MMIVPGIASVVIPIVITIVAVLVSDPGEPSPALVAEVPVLAAVLGLQIAVESPVSHPVVIIVDSVVLVEAPVLGLKGAVELTVVIPVAGSTPIVIVVISRRVGRGCNRQCQSQKGDDYHADAFHRYSPSFPSVSIFVICCRCTFLRAPVYCYSFYIPDF
jgi:hypothetical protein